MSSLALLPDPENLRVERLTSEGSTVTVVAQVKALVASCPICSTPSRRVHSRYTRILSDLPWQGLPARIELTVRRFVCSVAQCPRRIFTERLPAVASPYSHATERTAQLQRALAFVAGGEPGARLSNRLAMPVSPDTLLRRIRRTPLPEHATPRVLGVDDFAMRRGRRYGTLLVDLEQRAPIDMLDDRSAESFARWLEQHPGVEIISRDRGEMYAEGGRRGAPDAVHVADRWHLLKNLGDAVERFFATRHNDLAAVAATLTAEARDRQGQIEHATTAPPFEEAGAPAPAEPTRAERVKAARRERRIARFERVTELSGKGFGVRAIARETGHSRMTIRKYLRAESMPEPAPRAKRASRVEPFLAYLQQRWAEGCRNAQCLYREIREFGYVGSAAMVCFRVKAWRVRDGREHWKRGAAAGPAPLIPIKAPSPRRAMWLLLGDVAGFDEAKLAMRDKLLELCDGARRVMEFANEFQRIVRERRISDLEGWLGRAVASGLPQVVGFAQGLRQDRAAVEAALTYEWSNGQLEGQISKLKALKRAMFGRAKFDLLRARMLKGV